MLAPSTPDAHALYVAEFELTEPLRRLAVPAPYRRARILVRLRRHPVGFIEMDAVEGTLEGDAICTLAKAQLAAEIEGDLTQRSPDCKQIQATSPLMDEMMSWSVVICTRDRVDELARCLASVAMIDHPRFEVVVVDNAPTHAGTRDLVAGLAGGDARFRYVVEPRPGLSAARNAGVQAAAHDLVAFTDDDVIVDRYWLSFLEHAFASSPNAAAVTGLVPAAKLDTAAQRFFDARVQWSSNCRARLFNATDDDAGTLFPYTPGQIGTGANFAFRRQVLINLGPFDESLGAGTPAKGGEDLDIFLRLLLAGGTIAYTPAAIVWHVHRADGDALKSQLYAYGLGLGALATKYLIDRNTRGDVLRRLPRGLGHLAAQWRRPATSSVELLRLRFRLAEAVGLLAGPGAYARTRERR